MPNRADRYTWLLIAWGNPGRRDDAVALVVAEHVATARNLPPGGKVITRHQLGPELAEDIALADLVVFVDAHLRTDWPDLVVRPLAPAEQFVGDPHRIGHSELLTLARTLYGRAARAWIVAIRAYEMRFGTGLSAGTRNLVHAAQKAILDIFGRHQPCRQQRSGAEIIGRMGCG